MGAGREAEPLTGSSSSPAPRRFSPYVGIAPLLALLSCVLYSCNGELLQFLQLHGTKDGGQPPSALLNLIICHLGGLLFAPHFLFWKPIGFREGLALDVQVGSLLMALLLICYNYCWLLSAKFLAVGLTNAIFQTSVALVFVASILVFRDDFDTTQLAGVALALLGSFLASGVETPGAEHSSNFGLGIFFALCAAIGCMVYQVAFKYVFGQFRNDARFLAHIGSWVSLWHVLVIFPVACLFHYFGIETMQFPSGSMMVVGTMASAIIASTVNAMYICMVMWGSSMLLPCASAMSVPFTVGLDILFHRVVPARLEASGHMMVVISVFLIMRLHKDLVRYTKSKPRGEIMAP